MWAAVKVDCLRLEPKHRLSFFLGPIALQCFVQINTKQHTQMQRNWFSSKISKTSFFQNFSSKTCFFLWESFISCSCCLFVILEKGANGIKWVYPSSGIPLLTKGYREVLAEVITNLKHLDDQEMISWGTWKKEEPFNIPWTSLDNTHMATARNTGTACWIFFNFAHCVKLHNNALSLDMVFLTTTGPCSLPQII
jgi:hypothetical protein